jgi:hypothetical protein
MFSFLSPFFEYPAFVHTHSRLLSLIFFKNIIRHTHEYFITPFPTTQFHILSIRKRTLSDIILLRRYFFSNHRADSHRIRQDQKKTFCYIYRKKNQQ